jgi:hypothetical protein
VIIWEGACTVWFDDSAFFCTSLELSINWLMQDIIRVSILSCPWKDFNFLSQLEGCIRYIWTLNLYENKTSCPMFEAYI